MKTTFNSVRVHRGLKKGKKTHAVVTSRSKIQRMALIAEITKN